MGQCDRRPLERFQAAVGEGSIYGPYAPKTTTLVKSRKPIYYWEASGAKAGRALSVIWPYLSEPKQEQSLEAFKRIAEHNIALGAPHPCDPKREKAARAFVKYASV